MGFTPQEIDRMSVWQYLAAFEGWQVAHGQKKKTGGGFTDERLRELGVVGF